MSDTLTSTDTPKPSYYVATYKDRSAVIKRDADYQTTIKLVQKSIPNLRSANVQDIFISAALVDCGDGLLLISEEIWPEVVDNVKAIEVTLEVQDSEARRALAAGLVDAEMAAPCGTEDPTAQESNTSSTTSAEPDRSVSITVQTATRKPFGLVDIPVSKTIGDIRLLIETKSGIPAALQWLDISGQRLVDTATLEQSGLASSMVCNLNLCTRQTMIYIFAPRGKSSSGTRILKNVKVKLSLDRAWELAALYPQTSPRSIVQSASWTVNVHEDGKLVNQSSGTEHSCLFWDGMPTTPRAAASPPVEGISPSPDLLRPMTTVEPNNSVVISSLKIDSYISSVFTRAGFERGLIFLSWMKAWQQPDYYRHIAVRFLPQAKYEAVVPLSVSNCPDLCVVRFVLLYRFLSESTAALWDTDYPTYEQGPGIWSEVIGAGNITFNSNRHKSFVFELTCMQVF
ncbi:hypothetical protein FRC08_007501 [Ceratobasidium sp. 394]|nr:hypothetical protein FRC08_007501 [Ceratobasidium sp. 394]